MTPSVQTLPYAIVEVDPFAEREHEQMGTKAKFWYKLPREEEDGGEEADEKWLFKRCRDGTGEDWSEKIAAEVAGLLGLPHARVELAELDGVRGSVCLDFAPRNADLIHGNELLWQMDSSYPMEQFWRVTAHTVENVLRVLSDTALRPPASTDQSLGMTAAQVFVGYLALDALIGNGDRHHENWGLLRSRDHLALAPTYDHASSLGRELRDEKRRDLLSGNRVAWYAGRARSALYGDRSDARPLSTHAAFWDASARVEGSREAWAARVASLSPPALQQIIGRVQSGRITSEGRKFALQLMLENQAILCAGPPAS
jgi:hypothetical protein